MDIFKEVKRSIRAIHRFLNPFESEFDNHMNNFRQRNKDLYGFDISEEIPLNRFGDHYKDWMNKEDEE